MQCACIPERPILVNVDTDKLQQALTNVVSNAYKYSPKGGRIELVTEVRSAGDRDFLGRFATGLLQQRDDLGLLLGHVGGGDGEQYLLHGQVVDHGLVAMSSRSETLDLQEGCFHEIT